MPSFDIIKKSSAVKTFRVASVMGMFDLQTSEIQERFQGVIDLPKNWQIGLIYGKSGTGKTQISKQLFPDAYITSFEYSAESVIDDMPEVISVADIVKTFNSVGFSSPPSWLKPYSVLSNGEKMRVDLAKAILLPSDLFVFDEFTSVVDRQVAQFSSFAIQKAMRKTKKKFIAVTCHYDVGDWLLPDWIFNTDTMSFHLSQKKNRPDIKFEIIETAEKKYYWNIFKKYHYLSHDHNNAARIFLGLINGTVAGFISVFHFPHSKSKIIKKVHRLVVLPDYQGLGIGIRLLNEVGLFYIKDGWRYMITTSSPSLIYSLKNNQQWKCYHYGRMTTQKSQSNSNSRSRITASFEYINLQQKG